MKRKKLKTLGLIALLALPMCFMACGAKEDGAAKDGAKATNTLVYGSGDYTGINPAIKEHGEINALLFSGLTAHDKDNKVVPCLAESWTLDKKTNTYTFKLRKDVKWHDGKPFTAEDVKFTIETINNPDNMSEIASNYEDIKQVKVISDLEVSIELKAPNVAILDYLTVGMIPKHILEGKNIAESDFNKKPIGTGPYKLESWDMGQSITMVKNDDYFKGAPKIEKVVFKIVTDDKAKAMQLKSGELDFAQITPKDMQTIQENKELNVHKMKTADYRGIMYNFNSKFFSKNKELPNALSYGIDRQAIVDSVLLGQGKVAYSPLQMGEYNNDKIEKFEYNPKKAKEEIEKLGYKMGDDKIYAKGNEKLSFEIVCGEGDQVRIDMANICSQQFKEIGVDAKVVVKAEIDWAKQDTYLIGWGSPFDPDDHTYKVFGTDKGANYSSYSNKKIDELLTKAREVEDVSKRKEFYNEFQVEMTKAMPYTYIAYIDAIYAGKKNVKGISDSTVLGHHGVGIFFNIEEWTIE